MKREEEIKNAAHEYVITNKTCGVGVRTQAFIEGAKWVDKNVSWDMITKIWNLATDTAIAQMLRKMDEFKSEKEIKAFIKEKLKLK